MYELFTGGRSPQAHVPNNRRGARLRAGHLPRGAAVEAQGHARAVRVRTPLPAPARDLPRAHQEVSTPYVYFEKHMLLVILQAACILSMNALKS